MYQVEPDLPSFELVTAPPLLCNVELTQVDVNKLLNDLTCRRRQSGRITAKLYNCVIMCLVSAVFS